jgi:hypothetical protein
MNAEPTFTIIKVSEISSRKVLRSLKKFLDAHAPDHRQLDAIAKLAEIPEDVAEKLRILTDALESDVVAIADAGTHDLKRSRKHASGSGSVQDAIEGSVGPLLSTTTKDANGEKKEAPERSAKRDILVRKLDEADAVAVSLTKEEPMKKKAKKTAA